MGPLRIGNPEAGIGWRDSVSGKFSVLALRQDGTLGTWQISVSNWASPTSYIASPLSPSGNVGTLAWIRIRDDGINVYCYYSVDGQMWILLYSIAKASGYLGSSGYNQVVFGVDPYNSAVGAVLMSYTQTSP
jgi:hypothetical protein